MNNRSLSEGYVNINVQPSGAGCVECLEANGWWLHLRRCASCGHVGCCDNSPAQHATKHYQLTGHAIMQSFEPGEDWFWDFQSGELFDGPILAHPHSRPIDQPSPGPAGSVPVDWRSRLNAR